MAKDDQQEAFEKLLSSTLGRTIDFLKFAETKNAALLTFSSAWILGSVTLLAKNDLSTDWQVGFSFALPFFVCAALIAISSFLPKLSLSKFHKDPDQSKSLLYFGDAASFSPAAYKERVRERYYPHDRETATRTYLDDLSIQIAVNSDITTRKMTLFNYGACAVLSSFVVLGIPAIRYIWRFLAPWLGAS